MERSVIALLLALAAVVLPACAPGSAGTDIDGLWQGRLEFPGLELRIVLEITTLPDGTLRAMLRRPDEGDQAIPASEISLSEDGLRLDALFPDGLFHGTFRLEEGILEGRWMTGPRSQPLLFRRVAEIARPARPQTPRPPFPYDQEEVVFAGDDGVRLAGTLTGPREGCPCPAVILIPGAGAHQRDYVFMGHRSFLVLADDLTRRGIAVLRYDERGVGASSGDRTRATSGDYAREVLAGIDLLRQRPEVDTGFIGLIGHSEGGTIASLAAATSPDVAFIVMLGSPGLPGREYNLQYEESMGRALGLSDAAIAEKHAFQERVLATLLRESDPAAAEAELRRLYEELDPGITEAQINAGVRRFLSPWFLFNLNHDPAATLSTVGCPVLAVIGEKDVHVPPEGNLAALRQALDSRGVGDYRVEELPGVNHFFQTAETGAPLEYGKIEETISPVALKLIGDWIFEHTRVDRDRDRH